VEKPEGLAQARATPIMVMPWQIRIKSWLSQLPLLERRSYAVTTSSSTVNESGDIVVDGDGGQRDGTARTKRADKTREIVVFGIDSYGTWD
jgi:hypothetical protein